MCLRDWLSARFGFYLNQFLKFIKIKNVKNRTLEIILYSINLKSQKTWPISNHIILVCIYIILYLFIFDIYGKLIIMNIINYYVLINFIFI